MKRLIKSYEYGQSIPAPIVVKDIQDKITNDDISGIQYGPSISREFNFEDNLDYSEWALQQMGGKKMSNWIDDFTKSLKLKKIGNNEEQITAEEKLAEINVNDLPSIMWNDEEYRVLFNEDGTAEVLNNFGNHILTLDATTIDEVNAQLGDKQIVSSHISNFKKYANAISEDLLTIKQQFARYDNFNEEEFDAKMLDYNNMMKSIEETMNKIMEDNEMDITQRKDVYYNSNIELTDKDAENFKNTICPSCGNSNIVKTNQEDNFQYLQCLDCNNIFKVNLDDGKIYLVVEDE